MLRCFLNLETAEHSIVAISTTTMQPQVLNEISLYEKMTFFLQIQIVY